MFEHWQQQPIDALIAHIREVYHRPQVEQVARLHALCKQARQVDGAPLEVLDSLDALLDDLVEHADKEERVIFPWLSRDPRTAGGPVRLLKTEHDSNLRQLEQLQQQIAGMADVAYAPLARELAALAEVLQIHIALEDEVLFPRALAAGLAVGATP